MAPWLCDGLAAAGLPVICIDARHMKAAVSAMPVKTDRIDARNIAFAMQVGRHRPVHLGLAVLDVGERRVQLERMGLRPAELTAVVGQHRAHRQVASGKASRQPQLRYAGVRIGPVGGNIAAD